MRARFDGICIKCGGKISGFQTSPHTPCDDIGWRRRGETYGLASVAWHMICASMPDNMDVINALRAKHGTTKAIPYIAPTAYVPPSVSIYVPPSVSIPDEEFTEETEEPMPQSTPDMQAMINAAVAAAIGKTVTTPVKAIKPATVTSVSTSSK